VGAADCTASGSVVVCTHDAATWRRTFQTVMHIR